jgi:hypothetical protein
MGDPLTKPVLHLVNILVRTVGEHFSSTNFQTKIFGYSGKAVADEIRLRMQGETHPVQVTKDVSSSSGDESSTPFVASTSAPPLGQMAAILEKYPVDPTIVDPVVSLPEVTSTHPLKVEGERVVEINPNLTWNWLKAVKRERETPPATPQRLVQPLNRTVDFRNSKIREAICGEALSQHTAELLRKDRLERQHYEEVFRNYQIIPRQASQPRGSGLSQLRKYSTANYRAVSTTALRSSTRAEETPNCTMSLLRLMGIVPQ